MDPNFDAIGKTFVTQYYQIFDGPQRADVAAFYGETNSLMTFEGQQIMGKAKIADKIGQLSFQSIKHLITTIDCQPTFDGGVVVMVFGQLKTDDDPPHSFSQVFILKKNPPPSQGGFYVEHDVFRLALLS
ncbi:putative nuclear transport factor 2, partial [Fragariocoptes setiger]